MKPVNFAWNAVTTDSTGAPLSGVTYRLYTRPLNGNYGAPVAASTNSISVAMPTTGPYQALVTAVGPDGSESGQSNQVNFTSVAQVPATPTGLVVVP